MNPKLREIAEQSNVSITTVSLVLSGKGRISETIRQKVLTTAEQMGYRKTVKNYRNEQDDNIGILVSIDKAWSFAWEFIRPIIEEIEQSLRAEDQNTILIPIHVEASTEETLNKILRTRVKAIISLHFGNEEILSRLEELNIPVILVMNNNFQNKFDSVLVDDIQCAYEGTTHLITLGHKTLAYIECERPNLPLLMNDRFFGFRKAIEERGLRVLKDNIIRFEVNDMEDLKSQLTALFTKRKEDIPTGLFCLDDDVALRVMMVLSEIGIKVPDDVSIIAPGDVLDYSQSTIPDITTMRINTTYMGKIVFQMLINRLEHKPEDLHVLKVKHQLVQRGTTSSPPNIN